MRPSAAISISRTLADASLGKLCCAQNSSDGKLCGEQKPEREIIASCSSRSPFTFAAVPPVVGRQGAEQKPEPKREIIASGSSRPPFPFATLVPVAGWQDWGWRGPRREG